MTKSIALIGYGYWGPNVARDIFINKGFRLTHICDIRVERLRKAETLFPESVILCTEMKTVFDDAEVDAVAIAVETSAHYEVAKAALLAGKHVYIEKPFTISTEEAKELEGLARKKGLVIHVDHIMVYHPAVKIIDELIKNGEIGDVLYFDCSRLNLGNLKNDVSSMWDLSVHDLSIIEFLTKGEEAIEVKAMGANPYSTKESLAFLLVRYQSFIASIRSNWVSPVKERKMIIAGTKKMVVFDDVAPINNLIIYDKGFDNNLEYQEFVLKARQGDAIIPHFEGGNKALFSSLEHFRQCLIEERESMTGPEQAIRIMRILHEADKQLGANRSTQCQ